jgi:hypothetical protein
LRFWGLWSGEVGGGVLKIWILGCYMNIRGSLSDVLLGAIRTCKLINSLMVVYVFGVGCPVNSQLALLVRVKLKGGLLYSQLAGGFTIWLVSLAGTEQDLLGKHLTVVWNIL